MENVLTRVLPGVRKCSLYNREFCNTQKLRNHMKKRHLGKTNYECKNCNKSFGDSGTLKIHA